MFFIVKYCNNFRSVKRNFIIYIIVIKVMNFNFIINLNYLYCKINRRKEKTENLWV